MLRETIAFLPPHIKPPSGWGCFGFEGETCYRGFQAQRMESLTVNVPKLLENRHVYVIIDI
jgi:hypothetical protein